MKDAVSRSRVARHRTAIGRTKLSRPMRLAWEAGLVDGDTSLFDYGCGRGDDVRHLRALGVDAHGWDPAHAPDQPKRTADVVNLGYVLNVIESPRERVDVLTDAWQHARRACVISALVQIDGAPKATAFGDGVLTSRDTFQKAFAQDELEGFIRRHLGLEPVALGLGIFAAIRSEAERTAFIAARYRRANRAVIAPSIAEALVAAHREVFDKIVEFVNRHGRFPTLHDDEIDHAAVAATLGSLDKAIALAASLVSADDLATAAERVREDLLVYLALARFGGRPNFGALPPTMQQDILTHLGSYKHAVATADALLMSIGDAGTRRRAAAAAPVGKRLPDALYLHSSAIDTLPAELRVFEGCARRYLGEVEGANIVKLGLEAPKVSYLSYADFDRDPHPALGESTKVDLQTFRVRFTDFRRRGNPPVLHRKELFVSNDYPRRPTFVRLSASEERQGVLDNPPGLRDQWEAWISSKNLVLRGHRLLRSKPTN